MTGPQESFESALFEIEDDSLRLQLESDFQGILLFGGPGTRHVAESVHELDLLVEEREGGH